MGSMKEISGGNSLCNEDLLIGSMKFSDFASKFFVLGDPKELVEPLQHGVYRTQPYVPNTHVSGVAGTI